MNSYPFNKPIWSHVESLQEGTDVLTAFARKHPTLHPLLVSSYGPSCSFPSTEAEHLRDTFGSEGWIVEGMTCHRYEMGVRIELHLPRHEPKPFTL